MLYWFARKLKEAQEKDDERGFTLIELLVVVIIIGILAAIAIPTYLNQRKKAWEANVKSDLRNAATAEESYFTGHNIYTSDLTGLKGEGYNKSEDVDMTAKGTATTYCLKGVSAQDNSIVYYLSSGGGAPTTTACS